MKRTVLLLTCYLLPLTFLHAQTSNVQTVKGWTRTYIMGVPGGTVKDPTGTIADRQALDAAEAVADESSNLVSAARAGLTNALQRLYDAAGETNRFTGRVYLAADMDDDPDYANVWAGVMDEGTDTNGVLHKYCHYSRSLASPPKTVWRFEVAPGVAYWAPGDAGTNNALVSRNGYDCYDIRVQRPAQTLNFVLRTVKYMRWGTPDTPLDIDDAGLAIVSNGKTNAAYTGSVAYTNGALEITETYLSGFLYKTTTNAVEGL